MQQRTTKSLADRFAQIRRTADPAHTAGQYRFAVTYRPPDRRSDSFEGRLWLPLQSVLMFVMRRQWQIRRRRDDGQRIEVKSIPVAVYGFVVDKVTAAVHAVNQAAYDLGLPPSASGCPRYLACPAGPSDKLTTCRTAVRLNDACRRRSRSGLRLAGVPELPAFWFGFQPSQLPTLEDSWHLRQRVLGRLYAQDSDLKSLSWDGLLTKLRAEAAGAADVDAAVSARATGLLEAEWRALAYDHDGLVWWPQELFVHPADGQYARHPLSGTQPPTCEASPGQRLADWVYVDGRWLPQAQIPAAVAADMRPVVGNSYRNPAYSVLVDAGVLGSVGYRDWLATFDAEAKAALQARLAELDEPQVAALREAVRAAVADEAALPLSNADVDEALLNPEQELVNSAEARVQVIEMDGSPAIETMTYQLPSGTLDLYSVRPSWASHFEPPAAISPPRVTPVEGAAEVVEEAAC